MEITSIRIKKSSKEGAVLGHASISLDNQLVIHNIKLIDLGEKRILSFPYKKTKKFVMENGNYSENESYTDVVHPANSEFRNYLESEIFKVFDNEGEEKVDE